MKSSVRNYRHISSAWVKLYVAEPGQPELIQAVSHANLLISHLACFDKRLNAAARSFGLQFLSC
jgi:hypothetical protein